MRNPKKASPITIDRQFHCRCMLKLDIRNVASKPTVNSTCSIWVHFEEENTSSICPKTDFMTEMKSVSVVKWVILSNPFSCCRAIVMAAPAMNPTMAAWDRNSVTKPNLFKQNTLAYSETKVTTQN